MKKCLKCFLAMTSLCLLILLGVTISNEKVFASVTFNSSTKTYDYHQHSGSISIGGNSKWQAVSTGPWIRVNNGNGVGSASVTFDLTENKGSTTRTGQIMVIDTTKGPVGALIISQTGFVETLTIPSTKSEKFGKISNSGDFTSISDTLSISTNTSWTAKASSWITLAKTSGTSSDTALSFTVSPNTSASSRTGSITITTAGGIEKTCIVTQGKVQYIEVISLPSGVVTDKSATVYVAFRAACNWKITLTESFAHIESGSGTKGTFSIPITIDTNSTYSIRSFIGNLYAIGKEENYTFGVSQAESSVPAIEGLPIYQTVYVSAQYSSRWLDFYANTDWEVVTTPDFMSVFPSSGSAGYASLYLDIQANNSTDIRADVLTIRAGSQYYSIHFVQYGSNY